MSQWDPRKRVWDPLTNCPAISQEVNIYRLEHHRFCIYWLFYWLKEDTNRCWFFIFLDFALLGAFWSFCGHMRGPQGPQTIILKFVWVVVNCTYLFQTKWCFNLLDFCGYTKIYPGFTHFDAFRIWISFAHLSIPTVPWGPAPCWSKRTWNWLNIVRNMLI